MFNISSFRSSCVAIQKHIRINSCLLRHHQLQVTWNTCPRLMRKIPQLSQIDGLYEVLKQERQQICACFRCWVTHVLTCFSSSVAPGFRPGRVHVESVISNPFNSGQAGSVNLSRHENYSVRGLKVNGFNSVEVNNWQSITVTHHSQNRVLEAEKKWKVKRD